MKAWILAMALALPGWTARATDPAEPWTVRWVEGKAWKTRSRDKTPLAAGDRVQAGDDVRTEGGASAVLSMAGRVAVRVGPESWVRVSTLDPARPELELKSGRVLSRVKAGALYQVRTPSVTLGVRGTVFLAQVEAGKPDLFCLCEGTLVITPRAGPAAIVHSLTPHERRMTIDATHGALRERMRPARLKGDEHSLEQIRLLAKYMESRKLP